MFYKKSLIITLGMVGFIAAQMAYAFVGDSYRYPFYFGIKGGGGATTWGNLIPSKKNQSDLMQISTPISVNEGGALWGFYAGYEFMPSFAIETAYTHYPKARINFHPDSLFVYNYEDRTGFTSHTETVSLSAKYMVLIPKTSLRAFSSVGIAGEHRKDILANTWITSATFDVGFNYDINEHVMGEIGFNYTSGNGESELEPSNDFMPFLYSGYLRLAYRF